MVIVVNFSKYLMSNFTFEEVLPVAKKQKTFLAPHTDDTNSKLQPQQIVGIIYSHESLKYIYADAYSSYLELQV